MMDHRSPTSTNCETRNLVGTKTGDRQGTQHLQSTGATIK